MDMQAQDWLTLLGTAVVAVIALVLISTAGEVYGLGIALFLVAVVYGFRTIKRVFDRIDAGRH
ncbi:MAG: hypothetical protein HIU82_12035 [Proteobacteria bacterium]|jgi:hypothetical protein|nr:hypothetical protein [Pseudomonadota bacterium]